MFRGLLRPLFLLEKLEVEDDQWIPGNERDEMLLSSFKKLLRLWTGGRGMATVREEESPVVPAVLERMKFVEIDVALTGSMGPVKGGQLERVRKAAERYQLVGDP
jgi:hypothetical protein